MKEIKFRAWDKKDKLWVDHNQYLDETKVRASVNPPSILEINHPDWIFMQYTGLKDKNGVSIYEGDIVEEDWVLGKTIYKPIEITWNQHICAFCTGSKPLQFPIRWVVIGNIYENPELLDRT